MIEVYLDTCIISKVIGDSFKIENLKALDEICDNQNVSFVTTINMLEEINKTIEDRTKTRLKILFKLIKKLEKQSRTVTIGFSFPISFPMQFGEIIEDSLLNDLKKIFKKGDSEHIFQAIKNKCDFFLTADYKTIINKHKKWKPYFAEKNITLKIVDCIELEKILRNT